MNPTERTIDDYLAALRKALAGISTVNQDEIISEIRMHLRESVEQGADIQAVISHLGSPRELGAQYRENLWAQRTAQSRSPWRVLQGVFWLARTSGLGFLCFILALIGYGTGGAMIVSALMKPIMPKNIGLWVGPDVFNFGVHVDGRFGGGVGLLLATGSPAHDVLGWWYIPVATVIGILFIWGTTSLLRKLVKRLRTRPSQLHFRKSYVSPMLNA